MLFIFIILILITSVGAICSIWYQAIQREQKLRKEMSAHTYRNLKNRINPHFLFNSLNTIPEMLDIDIDKMDIYIQKLAEIYQFIMENEDADLILLEEELKFVRQYFKMEKEREKARNALITEVKEPEKYLIVPASVQTLLENALKQHAPSAEKPLIISVKMKNDYIVISNKIQKIHISESPSQTRLSNLDEKVKLITGGEVVVYQKDGSFVVSLPLIKA